MIINLDFDLHLELDNYNCTLDHNYKQTDSVNYVLRIVLRRAPRPRTYCA